MSGLQPSAPDARLGFMLYRCGLAVARGFDRALKPIETTPSEAGVLSALAYSGPNHVRGLARMLGLGRQTMVNVTRRLDEAQFVVRVPSQQDARLSLFEITPTGRRKLGQIETIASAFDAELRAIVGAGREAELTPLLQRIVDAPFLAYED